MKPWSLSQPPPKPAEEAPSPTPSPADLAAVQAQRDADPVFQAIRESVLRAHRARMNGTMPKPR